MIHKNKIQNHLTDKNRDAIQRYVNKNHIRSPHTKGKLFTVIKVNYQFLVKKGKIVEEVNNL